ncbi:MAG: RagB/SusD family nutrient uptake outer membrane protein [Paludibacter sp.]|nr:RagB/SusD family nutrient uptake outer membrane protein [Paludibacter sp.]
MKTKILIISLVIVLFTGCNDFLDETVYSFAAGETLFTNEETAEMALTGVYDAMNASNIQGNAPYALFARNIHLLTQLGCDEIIGRTDYIALADFKAFCNYTYNSESRFLADAWFALYAGIYRANNVIENMPTVEMDDNRKNEIILEAKFLRGFYYSYLTWFFGAVPTPLNTTADPQLPRTNVKGVYDIIISDLESAYSGLPEKNKYDSRINRYSAGAMLAKVYLHLASYKEYNVGSNLNFDLNSFDWVNSAEYYQKAMTISKDVYENSTYVLHNEYRYNFIADNIPLKKEQVKEALMIATFGKNANKYYNYTQLTGPAGNVNTNGGGAGWFPAMGELTSLYNSNDIRFKQNIAGAYNVNKETILGVEYFVPVGLYNSGSNTFLAKFRQSSPASRLAAGIPAYVSTLNYPIIRFADVVLMYAEAAYKMGDEVTARNLLKTIRLRATKDDLVNADILTNAYFKADFMDEIKEERSRELCGEGWRRFDLIRWGNLESVVKNLKTSNENNVTPNIYFFNQLFAQSIKDNFQSYKIWYPIPKREMEVNTNLVQNPEWN